MDGEPSRGSARTGRPARARVLHIDSLVHWVSRVTTSRSRPRSTVASSLQSGCSRRWHSLARRYHDPGNTWRSRPWRSEARTGHPWWRVSCMAARVTGAPAPLRRFGFNRKVMAQYEQFAFLSPRHGAPGTLPFDTRHPRHQPLPYGAADSSERDDESCVHRIHRLPD